MTSRRLSQYNWSQSPDEDASAMSSSVRLANMPTTKSAPAAPAPLAVATSPSVATRRWDAGTLLAGHPSLGRRTERSVPMPLDPQLQAMRDQRERDNVAPLYTMSLEAARAADLASIQAAGGTPEPVHEVTDRWLPGPDG